ncbi:hypothetical protein LR48_Vigan06g096700 [Vigna angularis]|uniref:Uncharacterized protein n=1 Tax=Phaseolus angularis TaxID=3914 RepID=A0A0L9USF4_PHAAN|nr:hypothetical protein LR48_Vigan06g096700 [Vigna angularis]
MGARHVAALFLPQLGFQIGKGLPPFRRLPAPRFRTFLGLLFAGACRWWRLGACVNGGDANSQRREGIAMKVDVAARKKRACAFGFTVVVRLQSGKGGSVCGCDSGLMIFPRRSRMEKTTMRGGWWWLHGGGLTGIRGDYRDLARKKLAGGCCATALVMCVEGCDGDRGLAVSRSAAWWWNGSDGPLMRRRRLWMVRRWLTAHGLAEAERRLGFQWVEDDAHVLGLRWRILIGSLVSARISDVASSEWFNLLVVDCHVA